MVLLLLLRIPTLQVIIPLKLLQVIGKEPEKKVIPAGKVSVRITPKALEGPVLVI